MKLLLKLALANRKHYLLFFLTIISMFAFAISSQMEMFSVGIIAKTGPDAFMLFAKKREGLLQQAQEITLPDIEERWKELAPEGALNVEQAQQYLLKNSKQSLLSRINLFLEKNFHVGKDLKRLALLLIVVALFKAVSLFCNRYFNQVIAIRVSRDLRLKYFEHIQKLPMSFYHQYDMGALTSRLTGDASQVAFSVNALLINFIQTPFTLLTTFLACFFLSWKLTFVIFLGFPLVVLPVIFLAKKIKEVSRKLQKNQEQVGHTIIEYLSGILTIKIFGMEKVSYSRYEAQNKKQAKLDEKSARYGTAARPVMHAVSSLFFAIVIYAGLYMFQLPHHDLFVFCALIYLFYEPLKKFAEQNTEIQKGVVAAERMFEVLKLEPSITDASDAKELSSIKKGIEFRNVSFRYGEKWVLRDLSFSVKKGEFVAIVGPTGAGKSTIAQLIPRLYDVQEGEILIDGEPLQSYTQKSIREQIAYVSQKPFLFKDTIATNISFGREFSPGELQAAARNAQAEEFILKLPGAYQHQISETGKSLSGGQQQRLAIARALVKKAPLLILDEATSSLDSISESRIKVALEGLRGKLTQIVIAHRLSTIEKADKILFLDHGRLIAQGTKDELLESCPSFKLMWDLMYQSENEN
jgi:ABC-type multidrug transport system fused ATPase/permease subunit